MGKCTDRNNIHPATGYGQQRLQGNAARGLNLGLGGDKANGLRHHGHIHIVKHDDIHPAGQTLTHLFQGIGFHLNAQGMRNFPPQQRHRLGNRSTGRDVIILDEDPVS